MGLKDMFGLSTKQEDNLEYDQHIALLQSEHAQQMNQLAQNAAGIDMYGQAAQQNTSLTATAMIQNAATNTIRGGPALGQATSGHRSVIDPNSDPAYTAPLSVLEGMWQVKWGDNWVTDEDVSKQDSFWNSARTRLISAGAFEILHSRYSWYRLKG